MLPDWSNAQGFGSWGIIAVPKNNYVAFTSHVTT